MQSLLHGVREYLTPVLTESSFEDKGLLTPEEFVKAGDLLVYKCPTWRWESGEPSLRRTYLPPDKQFLVTRNGSVVSCDRFHWLKSATGLLTALCCSCRGVCCCNSAVSPSRHVAGTELSDGRSCRRRRRVGGCVVVRAGQQLL